MPSVSIFGGAPRVTSVVLRQTFTGDGSDKTFQLTSSAGNCTFDKGSWAADNIVTTYPADVTGTDKKPTYDSTNVITRNRVGVSSIDSSGLVTLDYAPRNGVSFYVWYFYSLDSNDEITYYREDYVASVEELGATIGSSVTLDTTSFGGLLSAADTTVQAAMDTLDNVVASDITLTTGAFNDRLSAADTDVQTALGTLDDYQETFSHIDMDAANLIGSPTYTTLHDWFNNFQSPGRVTGGTITDAGSGTVNVTAGTGYIRATDSDVADLKSFNWSASNGIAITASSTRFIGVNYNSGSPNITAHTSFDFDLDTDFPLGRVVSELINDAQTLHILNDPWWVGDPITNILERVRAQGLVIRDATEGGLIISSTGTRKLAMTAGKIWSLLNEHDFAAFDTNVSGTFEYYWYKAGSGWQQTDETQLSNAYYNDVTQTALVALGTGKFVNAWVYAEADDEEVAVLYGQAQYSTLAQAQAQQAPTNVPQHIAQHGILLGRFILKQGTDTIQQTDSAFTTTFTLTSAADHGNLAGLGDDDHTQYLLVDGTRTATGSLTVTGTIKLSTLTDGYIPYHSSDSVGLINSPLFVVSGNWVAVGVNDTTYGGLACYGQGTGSTTGGGLAVYLAADHDTTIAYYIAQAFEDDLYIGPDTDTDAMKLTNVGDLHITAGTVSCYDLTDGYVPYHVADATGLANSPIFTDATSVGIGTASPQGKLEVSVAGQVRLLIRDTGEDTGYDAAIGFYTGTGAPASTNLVGAVTGVITQADPSTLISALALTVNAGDSAAEIMRVSPGGVGIDTTTIPTTGASSLLKLGAAGAVVTKSDGAGIGFNLYHNGTAWTYLTTDHGCLVWTDDAGDFGVWTAASGTAGNTATLSQKFKIDNAGQITIGSGTATVDYGITFNGDDNDGVLTWMATEDYFKFSDDVLIDSTEKLHFRDTAIYLNSTNDGYLDIVADTGIRLSPVLAVTYGGTGAATLADGGLLVGAATGAIEVVAAGLTTQILVGGGAATNPVWGTDIPTAVTIGTAYIYRVGGTDVSVADGGTGASTLTDHGVLIGSGTDAITPLAVGTTGQYLSGATGADPSWATLNQAAVAGLTTADSPIFATVKLSGLTDTYIPYHVADATGLADSNISLVKASGLVGINKATPTSELDILPISGDYTCQLLCSTIDNATPDTGTYTQISSRAYQSNGSTLESIISLIAHGTARTTVRSGVTLGGWAELNVATAASSTLGLLIDCFDAVPIVFGTNNTERARIDGNGDLTMAGGSIVLPASEYLNFGGTLGSTGYGIRDSGGYIQVKHSDYDDTWENIERTHEIGDAFVLYDDFTAADLTHGPMGWVAEVSGDGIADRLDARESTSGHLGMARLSDGDSAGEYGAIYHGTMSSPFFLGGDVKMEFLVLCVTAPVNGKDFIFLGGLLDDVSDTTITDGVYFSLDFATNATHFFCHTAKDGTTTSTDSTIHAADATFYKCTVISSSDNATVKFYIDDVLVATHTTNIPSGTGDDMGPAFASFWVSGAAVNTYIDAFYFRKLCAR